MVERRDVIKNKKAILQGYIDMTSEKIIDKITVSDVIKKANVSRATFYAHYKDIHTLKQQFEKDFMTMMLTLNEESIQHLFDDSLQSLFNIFSTFDKNKKMIKAICGNGSSESFFLLLKQQFQQQIQSVIHSNHTNTSQIISFTMASFICDNCRDIVLRDTQLVTLQQRAMILSKFIPKR